MANEQYRSRLTFDSTDEYRPEPPPPPEIPAWKIDGGVRVGIHTSIAGDISRSLEIAHGLGANALQIFSSSPRMWDRGTSRISEADSSRFRLRRNELTLGPLVIHGNYLINLASPDLVLRTRSIQAFHQEIVRATTLGADYLVFHPGSGRDASRESSIAAVASSLRQAVRGLKLGDLKILLENTAGQGSTIGARFEELNEIVDACRDLQLGVCIDTAHLFAAGWDIRTPEGWERALADIDRFVGLDCVAVVHVNDSKTALGSHVDRHEHVGKGKIGLKAFSRILNHPRLAGKAFILETPIDKPGDDRRNVAVLWKLLGHRLPATQGHAELKPRARKTRLKKVARSKVKIVIKKVGRKKQ